MLQGGVVVAPVLSDLQGVNLVLDGTSTFSVTQIARFEQGRTQLTAGVWTFTALTQADGTNFTGTGAQVTLPILTRLVHGGCAAGVPRVCRGCTADAHGSTDQRHAIDGTQIAAARHAPRPR